MIKTKEEQKKYRRISEADYKKFRRRERQLMKAKALFREAWRILCRME